jgi:hypothetical protein
VYEKPLVPTNRPQALESRCSLVIIAVISYPEQAQTKKDWFYFYHEDHEEKEE